MYDSLRFQVSPFEHCMGVQAITLHSCEWSWVSDHIAELHTSRGSQIPEFVSVTGSLIELEETLLKFRHHKYAYEPQQAFVWRDLTKVCLHVRLINLNGHLHLPHQITAAILYFCRTDAVQNEG